MPDSPFVVKPRLRRRKVVVSAAALETSAQAGLRSSLAMAGVALSGLWAMFATGAPLLVLHGVLWMAFGLTVILLPPRVKVAWGWWLLGLGILAGASMALLPTSWAETSGGWRSALKALGVPLGGQISLQPQVTIEYAMAFALSVGAAWFVMGHRVTEKAQRAIALLMALGIAAYAMVSFMAKDAAPAWTWDHDPAYGLFGNRNHTATVLVMGVLAATGLLMEAVRAKKGGWSGGAALALVINLGALLGLCQSRAGLVLLSLSLLLWVGGLGAGGTRYFSKRLLVTLGATAAVVAGLFFWADTGLKERLDDTLDRVGGPTAAGEGPLTADGVSARGTIQPFDFRQVIWKDTWRMIKAEPLTGVGLGQFPSLFPQYRDQAAIHSKCWHPESNWLMLTAEAGALTAGLLALGVGAWFVQAFRQGRHHRGWPLTLGCLTAALMVPVHGVFDVPAHHPGIAWPALVLMALAFRRNTEDAAPPRSTGLLARSLWRVAGGVILLAGVYLFSATPEAGSRAVLSAQTAVAEIKAHYARDAAEKEDPVKSPPALDGRGRPVDQLELAQQTVNTALRITPLEPELHYWRGLLSVNFSDEEAIADQAFAVERLLEPDWVSIPWRQGLAWLGIDGKRSVTLWQEALRRAHAAHLTHPGAYWSPEQLEQQIKSATQAYPEVWKAWEERGK